MSLTAPRICVLVYAISACVAVATFVSAHGGTRGDVDPYVRTIVNPEAKNVHAPGLLFNRWRIHYDREPWIVKAFLVVNGPSYGLALLVYRALEFFPAFDDPFPFGISYPSYAFGLMLAVGSLQWYAVGIVLKRVRRRRTSG